MFETTFSVLRESPLAIVPLAVIVWVVARTARRSGISARIARYVLVFGAVPPFCLYLLAELLGSGRIRDLARALLAAELRLATWTLDVIDSALAAICRAFLRFVAGLVPGEPLGGGTSVLPSWDPFAVLSAAAFLVAVFAVHFVAGIVVTWLTRGDGPFTRREDGPVVANEWLTAAGVVLFVSGLVWTLLQFAPAEFGRFALQTAVLASSMGVVSGVAASNLPLNLPAWWPNRESDGEPDEIESGRDTRTNETARRANTRTKEPTSRSSARPTDATASSDAGTTQRIGALERMESAVRSLFDR